MNDEERNKLTERWIDSALDHYTDAEPRPGYETRMLAAITAKRDERPRWRTLWMWAAMAAAVAVIVAVMALSVGRKSETPQVANSQGTGNREQGIEKVKPGTGNREPGTAEGTGNREQGTGKSVTLAGTRPHRSIPHTAIAPTGGSSTSVALASTPKQPQFPTPAPLNEQERLLLAYVRNTPQQEMETVIAQKRAFEKHVESLGTPEEQEKDDR